MGDEEMSEKMKDARKRCEEIMERIRPFARRHEVINLPQGEWRRGEYLPMDRGERVKPGLFAQE